MSTPSDANPPTEKPAKAKAAEPSFTPNMNWAKAKWFWFCSCLMWLVFKILYRIEVKGRHNRIAKGPVLYVANHQSFWDPAIVSTVANPRPMFSMARSTLWDTKWVGWLISSLSAIPVEQGAGDIRSIRKCVSVLKAGESLILYPEGARTLDGQVHAFSKGIMLLIKQAKPTILPIGIQGAYEVWPRGQKMPNLSGKVKVILGEPIAAEDLLKQKPDDAIATMENAVRGLVESL